MAANRLRFGTAGVPHSAANSSSIAGIQRNRELGLDAMELEFVRRVGMGEVTACRVRQEAKAQGIRLSAHAPYYINLNSPDPEKLHASRERLLRTARVAALCEARNVVFHIAYYHHDPPELVRKRVQTQVQDLANAIRDEGLGVCLRPETSGRPSQFGDLDEVLQLAEIAGVQPCIDVSHLHARSGGAVNSYAELAMVLDHVQRRMGKDALQDMHIHMQGIVYSRAGERAHCNLAESDLRYHELLQALVDRSVSGTIICESPNLEKDAGLLQRVYRGLAEAS